MATSRHGLECIIYESSTQGNSPTDDGNTYDANGARLHVVNDIDLSDMSLQMLEDQRSTDRLNERAGNMVRGLRNVEQTIQVYLTGKGEVTADGSAVAEDGLPNILEHCMGGVLVSDSTDLKAAGTHSSTSVELTDSSTVEVGQCIGVIDADDNNSIVHIRRVISKSTDTVGLDEALPFTPADGDKVPSTVTIFPDQDVMEDSAGASGRTHAIFVRKGLNSTYGLRELLGCKAALALEGLNRGELPICSLTYLCATYRTPADDGSTGVSAISSTPSFSGTLRGNKPVSMGPRTKIFLQDYSTTTQNSVHVSDLTIEPGIEITPIDTVTSSSDNMEGRAGYSQSPARPTASFTLVPHTDDYSTDLHGDTYKAFRLERQNPEGSAFAIGLPRAEVSEEPNVNENGDVIGTQVSLSGHEDTLSTTDVSKAPIYIALC